MTYSTEPGALDGHDRPLPQTIIPGAERSDSQYIASRQAQELKRARKAQKEPGGMFGEQSKQEELL